jgi:Ser/Thr protein kinase RdoA (MazF antagonist)
MGNISDDALFARLMAQAGRDPAGHGLSRVWRKRTATQSHDVLRYDGPCGGLILKRLHPPSDAARLLTAVTAQARAAQAIAGAAESVPEPLAFDAEARAVLMEAAPGQTVYDLLDRGGDAADLLRRAGRWLAAFHRAGGTEARVFQPRYMRDHTAHLIRQHAAGEITLARPRAFARHGAAVIALAGAYEGRKTLSAPTHGDMHLRNILLEGPRSWGIDFSASHTAPVGFDIARLLLHYTGVFGDIEALPPGAVLAPELLRAFFEGYDLVGPEDPSVGYLMRVRILMDWAAIPARRSARSTGQTRRLQRLARLAERALG